MELNQENKLDGELFRIRCFLDKILHILQHVALHYHDEISCFWYLMSACSFIVETNGPRKFEHL